MSFREDTGREGVLISGVYYLERTAISRYITNKGGKEVSRVDKGGNVEHWGSLSGERGERVRFQRSKKAVSLIG